MLNAKHERSMRHRIIFSFLILLRFFPSNINATDFWSVITVKRFPSCEAGHLLAVVLLQGLCRADHLPAEFACSGLVLRALFACRFAMPCPLPFSSFAPVQFCFAPTCSFPCVPGSSWRVVRTVLLAATTRACSGGPRCSCQQDSPYNLQRRSWRTWK